MLGLRRALTSLQPADVIAELKACDLLGRGGAAFPTWIKWQGAANAPGQPKYFVVNADESEPGTFKDRVLLEGDPCRILEGALIGAYAIGAQKIYVYIRGEYPTAIARVTAAVALSLIAPSSRSMNVTTTSPVALLGRVLGDAAAILISTVRVTVAPAAIQSPKIFSRLDIFQSNVQPLGTWVERL